MPRSIKWKAGLRRMVYDYWTQDEEFAMQTIELEGSELEITIPEEAVT